MLVLALDTLISEYPQITIKIADMPKGLSGLYYDNVILLNKHLASNEKHCVLAEEIGHYETTYGNITDLSDVRNIKLEKVARKWGYEKILSLDLLIDCHNNGFWTLEEVCFHLDITPEYLNDAVTYYIQKYGVYKIHNGYKITFDPLTIIKNYELE